MSKNRALGKGLSALISDNKPTIARVAAAPQDNTPQVIAPQNSTPQIEVANPTNTSTLLPLNEVTPGPFQPRRTFKEEQLQELADSISKNGVISPIVVRKDPKSNKYHIIAGERRWRASRMIGLTHIPTIIRNFSDQEALEIALVENIQRQDLTPIEEAEGFKRLIDDFSYTQEELAKVISKSRSHIANMLRILSLPAGVIQLVDEGSISMGHARALVGQPDAQILAERIVRDGLSVRAVEKITAKALSNNNTESSKKHSPDLEDQTKDEISGLEELIAKSLGMKVKIEDTDQGGKVTIFFQNLEQLDVILQKLSE